MINKEIKLLIEMCLNKQEKYSALESSILLNLKFINGVYPYLKKLEDSDKIIKENNGMYFLNIHNEKVRDMNMLCSLFKRHVFLLFDKLSYNILIKFKSKELIKESEFSKKEVLLINKIINRTKIIQKIKDRENIYFLTSWENPTQKFLNFFDIELNYDSEKLKVSLLGYTTNSIRNTKSPLDEESQKMLKELNLDAYIKGKDFILDKLNYLQNPILSSAIEYTKNKKFSNALEIIPKINDWKLKYIYNTDKIEGNPLTMQEVQTIFTYGELTEERNKIAIIETNNSRYALEIIFDLANEFNSDFIKKLHKVVQQNIDINAGNYKDKENCIVDDSSGELIDTVTPKDFVEERMNSLISWYEENKEKYNPLILASVIHNQFVYIHPFNDGNGRVARLLLNFILMKNGFYPIIFYNNEKHKYYNNLRSSKNGDLRSFSNYILNLYRTQIDEL